MLKVLDIADVVLSDYWKEALLRPYAEMDTWVSGPHILRRELWSEECLLRGVGPWDDDEGPWPSPDTEDRVSEYEEEFALRCKPPPEDPDSPPVGARHLISSEWRELKESICSGGFEYDVVQLQVWAR